jgi:hypothetical protein
MLVQPDSRPRKPRASSAPEGPRTPGVAFGFHGDVITAAGQLPIVVEILDPRTQRTVSDSASMGLVSDFMQSNDLVSKILAMVAEDVLTKTVLDELLGGTGTQFRVTPSAEFLRPGARLSFAQLAAHCSAVRGCVLCGVIEARAGGSAQQAMCVLNPPDKHAPRAWDGCGLVLIATDARLIMHGSVRRSARGRMCAHRVCMCVCARADARFARCSACLTTAARRRSACLFNATVGS